MDMIKNIGSFFEEHIEKMILGIVGLVCVWLLITRVIISPNEVAYGDDKYGPSAIDEQVYREAEALKAKINTPPSNPEPYKPRLPKFVAKLESAISHIDVTLWPEVPYKVDELRSGEGGGMYSLPRIAEVDDVEVEHIRAVAYVPTDIITGENTYDKVANEPNDIDLVTVEAKFDIEGLYERFKESFVDDVAEEFADPCLAKPIFAAVQLQRQELGEDGNWGDWQGVPRSKIDHYGKLFDIVEDAGSLPAGWLKVRKLQFDDKQLQIDLLQPEAYQIASAKEEWYPPTIHRKFLVEQRNETLEEKRKTREEEQGRNERSDSRRSRRTGTGLGIGTGGRTGRGVSEGLGGPGGIYGGVGQDTRRRTTRPGSSRRRLTDDGLGQGLGLSTDRRTRGRGRGRTGTEPGRIDDYMMQGLPGDRLTQSGPSMNDVIDEFYKISLNIRTEFSKLREPLVFWAHDDTVEPTKSYRYRIRLGVFNPVAGTNQLSKQDMSRKNEVILWSGFSDTTEPVEIPGRLYFFAKSIREAAKVVTVQVSKYVMGYWRSEDFKVSQGEVIGGVIETEPESPKTTRRVDPRIGFVATRPEDEAVMPETIDYETGAVMVDAVAVDDWSGGESLSTRRYFDMLYSFDGANIEHMPVKTSYWAKDVRDIFSKIATLQREKPEPFKAFGSGGRRRRTGEAEYYDEMEGYDEYMYEDMMMEDRGRY